MILWTAEDRLALSETAADLADRLEHLWKVWGDLSNDTGHAALREVLQPALVLAFEAGVRRGRVLAFEAGKEGAS